MIENNNSYAAISQNSKLRILFIILFSAVTIAILYIFKHYLWPFLFALILYIPLRPVHDFLAKYLKKRFLSSIIMMFSLIFLVLFPIFLVLLSLADQTYELYQYIQHQYSAGMYKEFIQNSELIRTLTTYFNIGHETIIKKTVEFLSNTSFKIFANLTAILTFSIKLLINLIFMLLILFFLFKDGNKMDKKIYGILPFPDDIEREVINRLKEVIKILFAGNLLIMIAQGFIVGIAFYVFDIRMPLLWATVTAVLSLIPAIGTPLVWLPVVLYFLYSGMYWSGLILTVWCFSGYILLENIVKPVVFGERLKFHPLILFFLLLGSIQTFNLPGIIIGPLLLTLFFSLWEIYKLLVKHSEGRI